jgi:hypothetical protein
VRREGAPVRSAWWSGPAVTQNSPPQGDLLYRAPRCKSPRRQVQLPGALACSGWSAAPRKGVCVGHCMAWGSNAAGCARWQGWCGAVSASQPDACGGGVVRSRLHVMGAASVALRVLGVCCT